MSAERYFGRRGQVKLIFLEGMAIVLVKSIVRKWKIPP